VEIDSFLLLHQNCISPITPGDLYVPLTQDFATVAMRPDQRAAFLGLVTHGLTLDAVILVVLVHFGAPQLGQDTR
jgi:hypothetical protein